MLDIYRTCYACPEQYDVFYQGKRVGYLRLRHGWFRADHRHGDGSKTTVYEAHPNGDGIFDDDERDRYLSEACQAILNSMNVERAKYRNLYSVISEYPSNA